MIGLGGVGLSSLLGAVAVGARRVVAVDLSDDKLGLARQLGATDTFNPASPGAIDEIKSATGGGVEFAFEMAGSVRALDLAYRITRRGGTTVTAGLPPPDPHVCAAPGQPGRRGAHAEGQLHRHLRADARPAALHRALSARPAAGRSPDERPAAAWTRSISGSIVCTRAKPCGRWWSSDRDSARIHAGPGRAVGRGGKDLAAAQQGSFFDMASRMAKAAGQEAGLPPVNLFDPQELTRANEAFTRLWSSAVEVSQTITRNIPGSEKPDPLVAELLGKIFDPRGWFSSMDGMDQALQRMAEGPRLADLWDTERKMLVLFNAWTALRRRSLEHNTVMLEAWLQAAGKFARDLNEKAERKEALGSWREVLALWVETANTALLETQRSESVSQEPARNPQGQHRPAPGTAGDRRLLRRDVRVTRRAKSSTTCIAP